jgi:hypothetical protein
MAEARGLRSHHSVKMGADGQPDFGNVDRALVPAALYLVADQGVYLMSNGLPRLLVDEGGTPVVAYARESDPNSGDEDWYEAKRSIMGGDDEATALPVEMFERALAMLDDTETLSIVVTPDHIEVILP